MTEHVIPALNPRSKDQQQKSCRDCPSFYVQGGTSYCESKLIPLTVKSWDSDTSEAALKRQASQCEIYGKKLRVDDKFLELKRPPVIFPVGKTHVRDKVPRLSEASPSCLKCKHFIQREDFNSKLPLDDIFSGVCAAKGHAISNSSPVLFARECMYYERGDSFPVEGIMALRLGPEYNAEFLNKKSGKKISHLPDGFDPLTHVSEAPIGEYETEHGIRAWVGITDPKGSNKVFLPIYDRNHFPSEEQLKIPTAGDESLPGDYVDHAGLVFKVAVAWVELDETPALIGEAGNGKTELFRHIAWIMQLPFERITITASSEVDDLAGKFLFENGETVFENGRLTRAWSKPNVICLDEPNTGPNDVLQFIRPLIDNSKQLVIDQNKGEQIFRNEGCFLGLAMNPAHDYRNIGANPMADADNSRLLHLEVPLPPEHVERNIIKNRIANKHGWEIPDKILDSVMAISRTLRQMSKDNEVPFSWGIRVQIKVAGLLKWFDFHDAYHMAMGGSVDAETQDKVISVVKANTPARS